MKKLISRRNFLKVCALAGSAAALSACGGKSTGSGDSAAAAVDVTGAVTFPLSEKVTFTGMTSFPVGSESEPNNRTIFKRLEVNHHTVRRTNFILAAVAFTNIAVVVPHYGAVFLFQHLVHFASFFY